MAAEIFSYWLNKAPINKVVVIIAIFITDGKIGLALKYVKRNSK
jgi:hypothetical protein